jgi:hypothetical protein
MIHRNIRELRMICQHCSCVTGLMVHIPHEIRSLVLHDLLRSHGQIPSTPQKKNTLLCRYSFVSHSLTCLNVCLAVRCLTAQSIYLYMNQLWSIDLLSIKLYNNKTNHLNYQSIYCNLLSALAMSGFLSIPFHAIHFLIQSYYCHHKYQSTINVLQVTFSIC